MTIEKGISGPHLAAAFLCEKVLQERDGVPSYIRVVDRFSIVIPPKLPAGVSLPPGFQVPAPVIQAFLVIAVKAGSLGVGKYNLVIKMNKPDGSLQQENTVPIFLNGSDDNGVAAISPLVIVGPEEGLFWIDIYFEESLLTRIPMRVLHQQMQFLPQHS
jgi:hypothetical protein